MAYKFNILNASGEIICHADDITYSGDRMGDEFVTLNVKSPSPVQFGVGDYIMYRNEKWTLSKVPGIKKSSRSGTNRESFVYDGLKFWPASYELRRLEMRDVVLGDNDLVTLMPDFTFFASNVVALAERIKANLDREYSGDDAWTVKVLFYKKTDKTDTCFWIVDPSVTNRGQFSKTITASEYEAIGEKDVSVSINSQKIWDVLNNTATKDFRVNYVVRGRTICIGTEGISYSKYFGNESLMYGLNKGCVSITSAPDESNDQLITRLYAYGNETNMPSRYYQRKDLQVYAQFITSIPFVNSSGQTIYVARIPKSLSSDFTQKESCEFATKHKFDYSYKIAATFNGAAFDGHAVIGNGYTYIVPTSGSATLFKQYEATKEDGKEYGGCSTFNLVARYDTGSTHHDTYIYSDNFKNGAPSTISMAGNKDASFALSFVSNNGLSGDLLAKQNCKVSGLSESDLTLSFGTDGQKVSSISISDINVESLVFYNISSGSYQTISAYQALKIANEGYVAITNISNEINDIIDIYPEPEDGTNKTIVFTGGAIVSRWPEEWLKVDENSNIPDNINVRKLMLPGFPDVSLKDKITKKITIKPVVSTVGEYSRDASEYSISFKLDGAYAVATTPQTIIVDSKEYSTTYNSTTKVFSVAGSISNDTAALFKKGVSVTLGNGFADGYKGKTLSLGDVTKTASVYTFTYLVTLEIPYNKCNDSITVIGVDKKRYTLTKQGIADKKWITGSYNKGKEDEIRAALNGNVTILHGVDKWTLPSEYATVETIETDLISSDEVNNPYIESASKARLGLYEQSITFDGSVDGYEDIYPTIKDVKAKEIRDAGYDIPAAKSNGDYADDDYLDKVAEGSSISDTGIFNDWTSDGQSHSPSGGNEHFWIKIKRLGFDLREAIRKSDSGSHTVSFTSGLCGGREFEINGENIEEDENYIKIQLTRKYDDVLGRWFPYKGMDIARGDKFVILGISMPDAYIDAASQRLLDAAKQYLSEHDYVITTYSIEADSIYMQRQHDAHIQNREYSLYENLKAGDFVTLTDTDIINDDVSADGELNIVIDKVEIKEGEESLPQYTINLRQNKRLTKWEKIEQNVINTVTGGSYASQSNTQSPSYVIGSGTSQSQIQGAVEEVVEGLRKEFVDIESQQTINGKKTFNKGITVHGDGSFGGDIEAKDAYVNGDLIVENDAIIQGVLHVTKLEADTVEVMESKHIGGKVISSPAGAVLNAVGLSEDKSYWRCHFPAKDENGNTAYNMFAVNDFVWCEQFRVNAEGSYIQSKCYWRRIVKVGADTDGNYIDIACGVNPLGFNDTPAVGDNVITFGNATDASRQSALVKSPVGTFTYNNGTVTREYKAPYELQYIGINTNTAIPNPYRVDSPELTVVNANEVNIKSGDKYVNILDELGDSFEIITVDWQASTTTGQDGTITPVKRYSAALVEPSTSWDEADYASHVDDFLVTANGYMYRFIEETNDGGSTFAYYWEWVQDAIYDKIIKQQAGFVSKSDFASVWASATLPNGEKLAESYLKVYTKQGESGKYIGGIKMKANEIVIEGDNFNLDSAGNVEMKGIVTAKSLRTEVYVLPKYIYEDSSIAETDIYFDKLENEEYFSDEDLETEMQTRGIRHFVDKEGGHCFVLSRDASWISQRIIIVNKEISEGGTSSNHLTGIKVEDDDIMYGVGSPNSDPVRGLWSWNPARSIEFANGVIELLGFRDPTLADGAAAECAWMVLNLNAAGKMINDELV